VSSPVPPVRVVDELIDLGDGVVAGVQQEVLEFAQQPVELLDLVRLEGDRLAGAGVDVAHDSRPVQAPGPCSRVSVPLFTAAGGRRE
jgi:hypothetical protein